MTKIDDFIKKTSGHTRATAMLLRQIRIDQKPAGHDVETLDAMHKEFTHFVDIGETGQPMLDLIHRFGALMKSQTLRSTETSSWYGQRILKMPPIEHLAYNVAFPRHVEILSDSLRTRWHVMQVNLPSRLGHEHFSRQ